MMYGITYEQGFHLGTQLLTPHGWQSASSLNKNTAVAQINHKGDILFDFLTEVTSFQVEKLYHIFSPNRELEFCVGRTTRVATSTSKLVTVKYQAASHWSPSRYDLIMASDIYRIKGTVFTDKHVLASLVFSLGVIYEDKDYETYASTDLPCFFYLPHNAQAKKNRLKTILDTFKLNYSIRYKDDYVVYRLDPDSRWIEYKSLSNWVQTDWGLGWFESFLSELRYWGYFKKSFRYSAGYNYDLDSLSFLQGYAALSGYKSRIQEKVEPSGAGDVSITFKITLTKDHFHRETRQAVKQEVYSLSGGVQKMVKPLRKNGIPCVQIKSKHLLLFTRYRGCVTLHSPFMDGARYMNGTFDIRAD